MTSSRTISILTINAWFGLDERGILKMKPLESDERREKRHQTLVQGLRDLRPTITA
jgi:hypothetical protein